MDFLRLSIFIFLPTLAAGLAVMSIDYGGEYVKIAIVKPGVPMEIVLNKESKRKTAAVVFIRNDERTFGDAALNSAIRYPANAYRHMHQLLGKRFDHPLVRLFQQQHPYYTLEEDSETGMPLFVHDLATRFSAEQLVAMVLQKCKEYAETFAEQSISETVITVPVYYNQAERRAMLRAADLAGLKVLQLINDNAAVALNYGIFRRKSFNATPSYYMFFDVGAFSTTATVVEYHIAKHKSPTSGYTDTYPQLVVRGVNYDRSLGGVEMQYRLQRHLATAFNKVKKSSRDVFEDAKAMQKLYKEAGRVKQILSANAFHFAQVESLMDDEDFRLKVTREEFEEMCKDLFDRVEGVVTKAIQWSGITLSEVSEVVLMGAGTRVPRLQQTLVSLVGRQELGRGLNTDEAAALGAVYQAAHLGKGFKVQKFNVKDAVFFPIQVNFERVPNEGEEGEEAHRVIHRTLFSRLAHFPLKKSMTFNKHSSDFHFSVSYGDLTFLTPQQVAHVDKVTLVNVTLSGVKEAFAKNNGSLSRGVKAHFKMDENCILHLEAVEASFEKTSLQVQEEQQQESTFSRIGKSFSNFFGGSSDSQGDKKVEARKEEEEEEEEEVSSSGEKEEGDKDGGEKKEGGEEGEKNVDEKKEGGKKDGEKDDKSGDDRKEEEKEEEEKKEGGEEKDKEANKTTEGQTLDQPSNETSHKNATVDNKKVLMKEQVTSSVTLLDLPEPSAETLAHARKHLGDMKKRDDEKAALEQVKNEIESFLFYTRDRLEEDEYIKCSTEEERTRLQQFFSSTSDWVEEQADNTPKKVYDDKLSELRASTEALVARVKEVAERPIFLEALNDRLNQSQYFLDNMQNYTGEGLIFTQVEYDTLDKLVKDVKAWNETMQTAQSKLQASDNPVLTLQAISVKINDLDREIKYLIAKVKNYQAKVKSEEEAAAKKKKKKTKKGGKKTVDDDDAKEEKKDAEGESESGEKEEGVKEDGVKEDGEKKEGVKEEGVKEEGEKEEGVKEDGEKKEGVKEEGVKEERVKEDGEKEEEKKEEDIKKKGDKEEDLDKDYLDTATGETTKTTTKSETTTKKPEHDSGEL